MKSIYFGVFVIFAAIYAAGTLGLGRLEFLGFDVKPGEVGSPLVGVFGPPAVLGLVFGQLIANTTSPLGPIDLVSPAISFVGLLIIMWSRKFSVLAGSVAYVLLTASWTGYMLTVAKGLSANAALVSALGSQTIAILVGYALYQVLKRLPVFRAEVKAASQLKPQRA